MAMAISVREVYEANFGEEMNKIACSRRFPISSFDTEFPGTIFKTPLPFSTLSPSELYGLMSRNVNALKLIQLGLTLSDAHGNLPQFGNEFVVWQFNFANFDENVDAHDPESICLLKRQGINFEKNKEQGIQLENFGREFKKVLKWSRSTWITFDGRYDYGYLIKILTEKVASGLNLARAAGKDHQSGSDSLLTLHVFLELRKKLHPAPIFIPCPCPIVVRYQLSS